MAEALLPLEGVLGSDPEDEDYAAEQPSYMEVLRIGSEGNDSGRHISWLDIVNPAAARDAVVVYVQDWSPMAAGGGGSPRRACPPCFSWLCCICNICCASSGHSGRPKLRGKGKRGPQKPSVGPLGGYSEPSAHPGVAARQKFAPEDGYLWKLNRDVPVDHKHLADIRNWRRRRFVLQEEGKRLKLAYLSEQTGGELKEVCDFVNSKGTALVQELEQLEGSAVALAEMDEETRHWAMNSLFTYNIAFEEELKQQPLCSLEAYAEQLPSELHPFVVQPPESATGKRSQAHILASTLPGSADGWRGVIQNFLHRQGDGRS
eukprot:TRINITY_DN64885_c0_g1_i1.p1 TRINITY_DN64885_c0_g1~~TRINITY_DN64885_c0_g1_i1.p1  ORF type:complete len:318 (-),score=62.87 TRINITY_DN64885_c0_g1_i1:586-1539(-)